jgi:hypothetical protein
VARSPFLSLPFPRTYDKHAFHFWLFCELVRSNPTRPPHQINTEPSIWHHSCFYRAWGWDQKDIPKRRIIATILRHVITQKSHNISFIVAEALVHRRHCVCLQLWSCLCLCYQWVHGGWNQETTI